MKITAMLLYISGTLSQELATQPEFNKVMLLYILSCIYFLLDMVSLFLLCAQ